MTEKELSGDDDEDDIEFAEDEDKRKKDDEDEEDEEEDDDTVSTRIRIVFCVTLIFTRENIHASLPRLLFVCSFFCPNTESPQL